MASIVPVKKQTFADKLSTLDKVADKINKKYGKKVMGRIGADEDILERLTIKYIPTPCRDLNIAIGGGIPRRRCTLVAGLPDSGKTSLFLETIALNMKNDPNFFAGWLESENSLEKGYLCDTFGIDPARFFYIPLDPEIGAEETLDIVQGVLGTGSLDMFVINSLKCLVPDKEMEASLAQAVVGTQARFNARMTRKFTSLVAQYETAFVLITHLSVDIGSMSRDPLVISGGHAIAFWSSVTLDMRRRSIAPTGELIGREEGVKVGVTVKKNHCVPDRYPYVKLDYYAVFGEGIEQILTSIDLAIQQGILEQHGNWLWWMQDGECVEKWSGKPGFRKYMRENPEAWERFSALLDPTSDEAANVTQLTAAEVEAIKAEESEIIDGANLDAEEKKKLKKAG